MCATIRNERGVGVVAALLFVLILASLGMVAVALVVEDMSGASACVDSELALGVAQAGLEFGTAQLLADGTWTGVAAPGKPVGRGSFSVAVTTTDENGTALPSGQKMVRSIGQVGSAVRQVRVLVTPADGAAQVYGRSEGDAVAIPSGEKLTDIANAIDSSSGPNGACAEGNFDSLLPGKGILAGWSASGLTGTVTKVEVFLHGYLESSITDDNVQEKLYYNNTQFGSTCTVTSAELNAHAGSANQGYLYIDVTSARSWTLADFTGDLEVGLECTSVSGSDLRRLYLDAVGFRITTSGGGGGTATAFKEITT
jgi:hypothetical protein